MSKNPTTFRNAPNSAFLTLTLTTTHLAQENAPTGFPMALNRILSYNIHLHAHARTFNLLYKPTKRHVKLRWLTKLLHPTTQTFTKTALQNFPRPNSQIRFSANSIFTSPQISNLKISGTAQRPSTAIEGRGINGVRRILGFWFFSKRTKRSKQPPKIF